MTIFGLEASISQRLAVAAGREPGLPGLLLGLVDPQLHLALLQLGCSIRSLRGKRVVRSSGLSQESSSCLGDDGPVPEDVFCSRELGGHHESDDVFAAYGYRDEIDLARVGQSSQELLGQSISCLEAENDFNSSSFQEVH